MVLAGSGGCGKTTMLKRLLTGEFELSTKMTIGVDFGVYTTKTKNGSDVTLQIWDFGGEERFRIMLPSYTRGASGCMLFFDLSRPFTFYELEEWLGIIRDNTDNIPILLIGSKADLVTDKEELADVLEAKDRFISENNLVGYFETSSKTGQNVKEAFDFLAEKILAAKK